MTCASCADSIEKAIKKLNGIQSVNVNFASEKATILYDTNKVRISEIKQAIKNAGYTPLEADSEKKIDEEKMRRVKEMKT